MREGKDSEEEGRGGQWGKGEREGRRGRERGGEGEREMKEEKGRKGNDKIGHLALVHTKYILYPCEIPLDSVSHNF